MGEQMKKRNLDRLERKRDLINKSLDARRERINNSFDQKKARLSGHMSAKQEQIIEAALILLAEKGLNDLSLRDIAKKLGIQAPALYWHFKSKSDLVDHMAESLLSREFKDAKPRSNKETWQAWLTGHMHLLRKAMLAYPDGGRVVAGAHFHAAKTLAQIFEDISLSLTGAGVEQQTALYTGMTIVHFTFGFVIEEQSGPTPEQAAAFKGQAFLANYPNLAKAIKAHGKEDNLGDRAYAAGLRLIIKGAESDKG
jgi:TetR/AcrR family transcriptional regulator, tetracycline repressor protein